MKYEIETFEELYQSTIELHPNAEKKIDEDRLCIYLNDYFNKRISYWKDEDYSCEGYIIEVYSLSLNDYVMFSENSSAQIIFNRIKSLK